MTASYYQDDLVTLYHGDALAEARRLPSGSVQTIVTSPPYFGLRDYGTEGQMGAEDTVEGYVAGMVALFSELRRVLADDGTLWLNLGDSYNNRTRVRGSSHQPGTNGVVDSAAWTDVAAGGGVRMSSRSNGLKEKDLLGIPWEVAFALRADGWYLRSEIIWAKTSGMPESVEDRPTRSHEHLFLLAKSKHYYYDGDAIAEPAVAGDRGSRFDSGKTAGHQLGRMQTDRKPRPQITRALELAEKAGLTDAHMIAIRAVGMNDAGKAQSVQSGFGKNDPDVQRLADEAKAALGGYYREFLSGGMKNKRDVWTVAPVPFPGSHFAVYPPELIRPCILAGSRPGDTVLDPFSGSGTTGMVATQEGRKYVGIDLNAEYLDLSLKTRFAQPVLNFGALA